MDRGSSIKSADALDHICEGQARCPRLQVSVIDQRATIAGQTSNIINQLPGQGTQKAQNICCLVYLAVVMLVMS